MIYIANCKINIGLNIVRRRADGYHDISTVMYPALELCDAVEVVHSNVFKFSSSGLGIDCNSDNNLCVKVYKLLQSEIGDIAPVHIHLHKVVPFGAGLGGGSADATFTLVGINDLLNLGLSEARLIELAAKIGSDTPFFVKNKPQLCSSRGEVMSDLMLDLSGLYLTIVKADVFISTREAFAGILPMDPHFKLSKLPDIDITQWKDLVENDFEKNIFCAHPLLKEIKNKLYDLGAIYSSMSGSGSAIYSLSHHKISAEAFDGCFCRSYKIK
ncbi:MAG: 4-(cytidine 5'-diphospho)-2-C-methyl-D-erythritol kinase [Rikenellaceae bacterium]